MIRSGAGAAVILAAVIGYRVFYGTPRDAKLAEIATARTSIASLEKELEEQAAVSRRLKDIGRTMLGRKEDLVADRFRNGLGKIAEECGLVAIQDNSGPPRPQQNPLASNTKAPSNLRKVLKKAPDFLVVNGYVEGVGTLEHVLRTLAVVQAQPWVHRVDGFSISLAGRDREHFKVRIEVATLLAPDLAQTQEGDAPMAVPPVGAEGIWRSIAARNPFKEPAPKPAPVVVAAVPNAAPAPAPQPPPPNPYADWKLSAVVAGGQGVEAWLVNPVSKQSQVLRVGAKFIDAVFVEGAGERAVFEMSGQKYELLNGEPFTARRLVR